MISVHPIDKQIQYRQAEKRASERTATAQQTLRLLRAGDAAYFEKSYGVALKHCAAIENRPNPFLTGQYERLNPFGAPTTSSDSETDTLYQRVALNDGAELNSGELIEVELELESKNDYDYLLFEDIKPAVCEPVEVRSGDVVGKGAYANRELRDQRVAFFLGSLPQGRLTLSYRLRAEMPGQFRSLPVNGYAMYAPDIRALSDEHSLSIRDETP